MRTPEVTEVGNYTVFSNADSPELGLKKVKVFRLSENGPLEISHPGLGSVPLSEIRSHYFWQKEA